MPPVIVVSIYLNVPPATDRRARARQLPVLEQRPAAAGLRRLDPTRLQLRFGRELRVSLSAASTFSARSSGSLALGFARHGYHITIQWPAVVSRAGTGEPPGFLGSSPPATMLTAPDQADPAC